MVFPRLTPEDRSILLQRIWRTSQRVFGAGLLVYALEVSAHAQVAEKSRFEILHAVIATQAATRIGMPFGDNGVELSDTGSVSQNKLVDEIKKRGESVPAGRFVTVTKIEFSERFIEIEVDGGGKSKGPGILSRIGAGMQNGIGGGPPKGTVAAPMAGSKIVLRFAGKAPANLTSAELMKMLGPILDFGRPGPGSGVAAGETGEGKPAGEGAGAEVVKEARIGMDHATVIRVLGRPNNRVRETVNGVDREDWIYNGPGLRTTFVTFESDVVVGIREYER